MKKLSILTRTLTGMFLLHIFCIKAGDTVDKAVMYCYNCLVICNKFVIFNIIS